MIDIDMQIAKASGWQFVRRGDGGELLDETGCVQATVRHWTSSSWQSLVLQAQEFGDMPRWSTDEQAMLRLALRTAERIEIAPYADGMYKATFQKRHRESVGSGIGARPALALARAWLDAAGVSIDATPTTMGW